LHYGGAGVLLDGAPSGAAGVVGSGVLRRHGPREHHQRPGGIHPPAPYGYRLRSRAGKPPRIEALAMARRTGCIFPHCFAVVPCREPARSELPPVCLLGGKRGEVHGGGRAARRQCFLLSSRLFRRAFPVESFPPFYRAQPAEALEGAEGRQAGSCPLSSLLVHGGARRPSAPSSASA